MLRKWVLSEFPPTFLARCGKNARLSTLHLRYFSGLSSQWASEGWGNVSLLPGQRDGLLLFIIKSSDVFRLSSPQLLETCCTCSCNVYGHIVFPSVTQNNGNQWQYADVRAPCCAMSNRTSFLSLESHVFCQHPRNSNRLNY